MISTNTCHNFSSKLQQHLIVEYMLKSFGSASSQQLSLVSQQFQTVGLQSFKHWMACLHEEKQKNLCTVTAIAYCANGHKRAVNCRS